LYRVSNCEMIPSAVASLFLVGGTGMLGGIGGTVCTVVSEVRGIGAFPTHRGLWEGV
jgi:hypothetical protein